MDFRLFHKYLRAGDDREVAWMPSVGAGWLPPQYAALRAIDALMVRGDGEFYIDQVKEKLGTLRFDYSIVASDEICAKVRKIVDDVESATAELCEECGDPGRTATWTGAWYRTLCIAHARAVLEEAGGELPEFEAWKLVKVRYELKIVTADGLFVDFESIARYACSLVDRIASTETEIENLDRNSAAAQVATDSLFSLEGELVVLQRAWFLTGGRGDLDSRVSTYSKQRRGE